jgi:phosphate transport system protein
MDKDFEEHLKVLRETLLRMGGLVEEMITRSIKALVERESELAEEVIASDERIDRLEVEIDGICVELLALRQPVARDLRFITIAMKISTDLERIGDLAVNISERVIELNREPALKPYIDLPRMAGHAQKMLKEALDAFVNDDTKLAMKVCADDKFIDDLTVQIYRELLTYMMENPLTIARATKISFLSKYLERIGDHATNIAEKVVYMVEGRDIRHRF